MPINRHRSRAGTVASYACVACRKNKRRCDKALPSCSLCARNNRDCEYEDTPHSDNSGEIGDLRKRIQDLEQHVSAVLPLANHTSSAISAIDTHREDDPSSPNEEDMATVASYLDSETWSGGGFPKSPSQVHAEAEIESFLGSVAEIEDLKARYFASVHTWMPIVSKLRLDRSTKNIRASLRADVALLLLSMKLLVTHEDSPRSSALYISAKRLRHELELNDCITLRTIQAGILICVYEVGHAVYPGAFMTISACARQGVALGLHHKMAPQRAGSCNSWVDWEERLRIWWMIVLLDRYIGVGADHQPLCTDDPTGDSLLPSEDSAWDNGEMICAERVSLSSDDPSKLSAYARLAQASNLLGRAIRHCSDTSMEREFILDDFDRLCRTIRSFLELLATENGEIPVELDIAAAIAYSALFKIVNHHSCDMYEESSRDLSPDMALRVRECTNHSWQLRMDVSRRVVACVQNLSQTLTEEILQRTSPFILHSIYSSVTILSYMAYETDNPTFTEGKEACQSILRSLGSQWKAADAYLALHRISEANMCQNR